MQRARAGVLQPLPQFVDLHGGALGNKKPSKSLTYWAPYLVALHEIKPRIL
jgi:hypothetical protein